MITKKSAAVLSREIDAFVNDFERSQGRATYTRGEPTDEGQDWYIRAGGKYRRVTIAGPGQRVNSWNYTVLEGPDQGRMGSGTVFYAKGA